ncbi:AAA family ATPase [Gynuella sunshinyii]|uniref:ATPase involved in DNA repair n=1 Tax=Gynuella sunshinyii YC6258 TaxID=1445510 RepID=A0A0C5VXY8_9GAMM|nr:AAA family ATPase [Gynuella sunshinyii]AJQ95234.1 ATPase involved in DNA repair [Gynuella sunshinyii YC6258]
MKILELRFQNLNSLYGEWKIDFTDPEYVSNGIFALVGPTGAGKSTILDAICLALYGRTPRLGNITKSTNGIMSRQTSECYAEVVFETQTGVFRCKWTQRRARRKADGALQTPEHQIANAGNGQLLETKKSQVAAVIEACTGMDFDRFTRSILLAQGGFDTFLKADAEQKSKILEQITGTGIYTDISRMTHERQRQEQEKLTLLQAETKSIVILTPEKEMEIRQTLHDQQQKHSVVNRQLTEVRQAIGWWQGIETLRQELRSLMDEQQQLKAQIETFTPQQERLNRALKAATLDGQYATLTAERRNQADDQAALSSLQKRMPELEKMVKNREEAWRAAEQNTVAARTCLTEAMPLLNQVRALDQSLKDKANNLAEADEAIRGMLADINVHEQQRTEYQQRYDQSVQQLQQIEQYCADHCRDESLVNGLAGIEVQFADLLKQRGELQRLREQQQQTREQVEKYRRTQAQCQQQDDLSAQKLKEAQAALQTGKEKRDQLLAGRLLREHRAERDALQTQLILQNRIADLEEYRQSLEDGKPCPLCGATAHPYAEGNVPSSNDTEKRIAELQNLITQVEAQEEILEQLAQRVQQVAIEQRQAEQALVDARHHLSSAEKSLAEITDRLSRMQAGYDTQSQTVVAPLQTYGVTELGDDVGGLLQSLRKRAEEWQQHIKEKNRLENAMTELKSELKSIDVLMASQHQALQGQQQKREALKQQSHDIQTQRQQLFGNKQPDAEQISLQHAIDQAIAVEKNLGNEQHELQRQLTEANTRINSLSQTIEKRKLELQEAEASLLEALHQAGFMDENELAAARCSIDEREALTQQAKQLEERQVLLTDRKQDREARLAAEQAKQLTEQTPEQLQSRIQELEQNGQQLNERIASLAHQLRIHSEAQERFKTAQVDIQAQTTECERWNQLHSLIGSADGKKYRNFAQGLTFELLVSHANRQLEKMTDRYLLLRDSEQPLELNVLDNYQAGEVRSTRNLSGGESFIVSLALALGLSMMASRKVRVDSMFLDEGFGTLDEDTLDTALETLSGVQQGGKLIGVISHVPALKERIGTQIQVSPLSGGKSALNGPGCSHLFD